MTEPRLRQRRHGPANDLSEPLLGYDSDSEAHRAAAGRGAAPQDSRSGDAIVPYSINAYDWAELVRHLVAGAVTSLRGLASTISSCVSWLRHSRQQLSVAQAARLETLRRRIAAPYDSSDPQHQEALRLLWDAAFPGEPFPAHLKSERWKDMGWQGTDPGTDFRGAGFISLENHLYMAKLHPALFDTLRHKRDGIRSEWEYPFAVAGVNLTFVLIDVLQLRDSSGLPRTAAGRAFLELLADGGGGKSRPPVSQRPQPLPADAPFEEIYCEAFRALDRHWLAAKATYMDFPSVMAATRKDVERALVDGNGSLEDVLRLLHGS